MPLTPQAQYRISVAGSQPEQQSHADVQALVDADTAGISVMSLDQTSGWQAPSAFGIVKKVPDAPTAPQAPKSTASNGAPAAPTAPTISQSREPGTIQKIFTKSSTIADRLLSGFSENMARKLAKMAGQPDPITGEKLLQPHQTPQVESEQSSQSGQQVQSEPSISPT